MVQLPTRRFFFFLSHFKSTMMMMTMTMLMMTMIMLHCILCFFSPFWALFTHPFLGCTTRVDPLGSAFEEVCFTSYLFSWFVVLPLWLDKGRLVKVGWVYLSQILGEWMHLLHVGCSSLPTLLIQLEWGWLLMSWLVNLPPLTYPPPK